MKGESATKPDHEHVLEMKRKYFSQDPVLDGVIDLEVATALGIQL